MRVAIVSKFLYRRGGAESVLFGEASLLRNAGHTVFFFSTRHPENIEVPESRFFPEYLELGRGGQGNSLGAKLRIAGKMLYNREAARQFDAFIQEYKPDIIHCHLIGHHLGPSLLPVARFHGIPVVQTVHDYHLVCPNYTLMRSGQSICDQRCFGNRYWHCVTNRCIKNSLSASLLGGIELALHRGMRWYEQGIHAFLCPSLFLKDILEAGGVPAGQLRYLPNFIDPDFSTTSLTDKEPIFTYFGRLSYEKGLTTLLKAFQSLPEVHLQIIGTGPEQESLEAMAETLQLQNVKFLGYQSGQPLKNHIAQSRFIILPSEWYENAPMSILEAFGAGTPVIGSNIGGIPEMLRSLPDKRNAAAGILFDSGNPESLVQSIQESLAMSGTEYQKMVESGRSSLKNRYSPEAHLQQLLKIYQECLSVKKLERA
jgi:glycosyltransferase involved in cell wall biosynthesis